MAKGSPRTREAARNVRRMAGYETRAKLRWDERLGDGGAGYAGLETALVERLHALR